MTTDDRRVFRIAAGQRNRDYSERFISNDLAAIGPGREWLGSANDDAFSGNDRRALKAFYDMEVGDVVLMNVGSDVAAIGIVREKPKFRDSMPLIGNWDLFHVARVAWAPTHPRAKGRVKGQPNRASHVNSAELLRWTRRRMRQLESEGVFERATADFPFDESELNSKFRARLPQKTARTAGVLWESLQQRHWNPPPSENESTALLVVPFLLEIGWPESQLSLEWNRVDIAAFKGTGRSAADCQLLVEVKRPGMGLDYAMGQAFDYATKHDTTEVPVLVTDGYTYRLFRSAVDPKPLGEVFLPVPRSSAEDFVTNLKIITPG